VGDQIEQRYQERLQRYVTAMRNEKPDRVPIRPFVAEFIADYAGYTHQQVTHDFDLAFEAVRKCAADFDWDATVGNLVYNWLGVTKAVGWKYFAFPGVELPSDGVVQYLEPNEENAFMKADEYDQLIDDPTAFLFNVWLPRITDHIRAPSEPVTYEHNIALLNGGMSLMSYWNAFADQTARLRAETGTVSAISGLLKAPLDIIGDKLRGYIGLSVDLMEQPNKVLAACEALMPHLAHSALSGADPDKNVPITIWMHRGCVPFVSYDHFNNIYWATLKPIVEHIWSRGHQVLFYAEGNWDAHLEAFAQLPAGSIVYHVDQGDIFKAHKVLGERFCLSGGIPNFLLSFGTPEQVRAHCKQVIDEVAQDGGYILDGSAIIMDAKVENMRAMTDFVREYGVYSQTSSAAATPPEQKAISRVVWPEQRRGPGVCIPWEDKRREFPVIKGDEALVRSTWEVTDSWGYAFIWNSFTW
jgi:uroporphyrinogen-III decarboxylase